MLFSLFAIVNFLFTFAIEFTKQDCNYSMN